MKRESLVLEIDSYIESIIFLYDEEKIVDKASCFKVFLKIFSLREDDFPSKDKYKYFLRHCNQPTRRVQKFLFEKSFVGNNLNEEKFLWLCNYLHGIKDRLK